MSSMPSLASGVTPARILVVEDDRMMTDALSRMLETAGFTPYVTRYGEDALDLAKAYRFDLVLLDLSLPDMAGQTVLSRLKQAEPDIPIIILSGETGVEYKVEGLREGADDYITKPFNRDELIARIHALLRRARASSLAEIHMGPLAIQVSTRRAVVNGEMLPLTGKEYACLEFLAMHRGMTLTKEMFLAHLYGGKDEPEMKIIDVFICKLRKKLTQAGIGPIIETVWGRGYTINVEAATVQRGEG